MRPIISKPVKIQMQKKSVEGLTYQPLVNFHIINIMPTHFSFIIEQAPTLISQENML
jgi:hypothetical protein